MEKHTPTPWQQYNEGSLQILNDKGIMVAQMDRNVTGADTLEVAKANAELIVKAVNAHQSLVDLLTDSYLALQIASNKNMTTAVNTDSLRASLRNKLSDLIGIDGQELQETIEKKAILSNTLNQTL